MKTYRVQWSSPRNVVSNAEVIVRAETMVQAQDKFFEWLRRQPVYQHMWAMSMEMTEVDFISPEEVIE